MADENVHFKRNRKANFSQEEISALVDTCATYKDVIFGRLSPNVPPLERENAWFEVLRSVNEVSACGRTLQEIKIKWKQIKQVSKNKDEHFKTKRHNSITGNLRREGEFYHELEDLFDDEYESIATNYDPPSWDYDEDSFNNSLPLQERLQTNNKSQGSPTPNSVPKQENSNRSTSPQNNEDDRDPDEVCLRWNSHHSNMKSSFPTLLEKEQYVDVTLCSEGQTIRCHRLILSSCSSYFDEILSGITPLQHPVIFLKGTPFWILKSLIDFMYVGEVHIEQAKLQEILEVAELLKIKGLTGKTPSQNPEPKEDTPKKQEKVSPPAPVQPASKPVPPRSVPPLRLAVTKEQAASMQTVDPLSLLKPSFYEESAPPKRQPIPIRPKYHHQSLAEFSAKQKEWLSKKIAPKKKFKRKSSDHDPSPPPVILRKGTKSRPIVKAPKYYHMEYEEKKDDKQVKCEDEEDPENPSAPTTPSLLILPISSSTPVPQMPKLIPAPSEPTFDISNVKSEPIDMDIEENYVDYDSSVPTVTPSIRITEPRTVSADESNVFVSNPNSPVPENDLDHNGVSPEEENQVTTDKANEQHDDEDENKDNETEPDPEPEEQGKDDNNAKD